MWSFISGLMAFFLLGSLPACSSPQVPAAELEGSKTPESQESPAWEIQSRIRSRDDMVMVLVPGGSLLMGSTEAEIREALNFCRQVYSPCNAWYYEREGPQHRATVSDYWIDQTEVKNEQYKKCVEEGVCPEPAQCSKGTPTYYDSAKSDHPVICVSWEEARVYCSWAGVRLPTEAEWEFALRGPEGRIYPWGEAFDGSRVNYCDVSCGESYADQTFNDSYPSTAPVRSFPEGVSWVGAYNLGGNVMEWVSDWFGPYPEEGVENPTGPQQGSQRIAKGCSWYSPPQYCRGAARPSLPSERRLDYLGFRCAGSSLPGE